MKYLLLLLVPFAGSLQIGAQTRAELDNKYGQIDGNRYHLKPGVAAEVTFSENGKVKTIRIVSDVPKDKNALLRAKDVRDVVREMIPDRICHLPISTSKIEAPCPPRNGCQGLKEEWKGATTLMVWYGQSVAYNDDFLKIVLTYNPPKRN